MQCTSNQFHRCNIYPAKSYTEFVCLSSIGISSHKSSMKTVSLFLHFTSWFIQSSNCIFRPTQVINLQNLWQKHNKVWPEGYFNSQVGHLNNLWLIPMEHDPELCKLVINYQMICLQLSVVNQWRCTAMSLMDELLEFLLWLLLGILLVNTCAYMLQQNVHIMAVLILLMFLWTIIWGESQNHRTTKPYRNAISNMYWEIIRDKQSCTWVKIKASSGCKFSLVRLRGLRLMKGLCTFVLNLGTWVWISLCMNN